MSGLFLAFEGIDGCGKSTQLARARTFLENAGLPTVVTREPGGTPLGESIRELLLAPRQGGMDAHCELLLYLAARAEHLTCTILPQRAQGAIVLCDRFFAATFAYQGFGRRLGADNIATLNAFACRDVVPDWTFVFDCDLATARSRLGKTGTQPDRLESEDKEFFRRTRQGYHEFVRRYGQRSELINANGTEEEVFGPVAARLEGICGIGRAKRV